MAALTSSRVTFYSARSPVRSVSRSIQVPLAPRPACLSAAAVRGRWLGSAGALGTILAAAARARRRSTLGWGASCVFWSLVYAWMVVIRPVTMPISHPKPLPWGQAIGGTDAPADDGLCAVQDVMVDIETMVFSSPVAGAEITLFFAPAVRWAAALSLSVKKPVTLQYYVYIVLFPWNSSRTLLSIYFTSLPFTIMEFSVDLISCSKRPWRCRISTGELIPLGWLSH